MSTLQEHWNGAAELAERIAERDRAAKAELEALRKDAERYRWLRDCPPHYELLQLIVKPAFEWDQFVDDLMAKR